MSDNLMALASLMVGEPWASALASAIFELSAS